MIGFSLTGCDVAIPPAIMYVAVELAAGRDPVVDGAKIVEQAAKQVGKTAGSTPTVQVVSTVPSQASKIVVTGKERLEVNKFTIPIDNCGGSSNVSQKISQSQSFVHKIVQDNSGKAGLELSIPWAKLMLELQTKYGYEDGQTDTRTINVDMSATPHTNQSYVLTWYEEWEIGTAEVVNNDKMARIPFRVKTNMIYDMASQQLKCP